MTIFIVTNEYAPRLGGAGVFADRMARKLNAQIISPKISNKIGVSRFRLLSKLLWLPELMMQSVKLNKENKILINDFGAAFALYLLGKMRSSLNKSQIYIHHGLITEGSGKAQNLKEKILKVILDKTEQYAVSEYMKFQLEKKGFKIKGVLYPGVEEENTIQTSIQKKKHNGKPDINFISIARINKNKLPIETISFLAGVAASLKTRIIWTIVGDGELEYIRELKLRASKYGNVLSIIFLGRKQNNEIFPLIDNCDFVINPSQLKEACPTISLEAAQRKKPYLYCGNNGNHELSRFHSELCTKISLDEECAKSTAINIQSYWLSSINCICEKIPSTDQTAVIVKNVLHS